MILPEFGGILWGKAGTPGPLSSLMSMSSFEERDNMKEENMATL